MVTKNNYIQNNQNVKVNKTTYTFSIGIKKMYNTIILTSKIAGRVNNSDNNGGRGGGKKGADLNLILHDLIQGILI